LKKKVSFDIDVDLLKKIDKYVKEKDIKKSDFFRSAVEEYFEKINKDLAIVYIINNDELQKKVIDKSKYKIIKDEDVCSSELKDLEFVEKGYIVNNDTGEKLRYYSKKTI